MKKNLLNRSIAIALALVLVLGTFVTPALAAEDEGVIIKLHYNRPDGVYDDWSVWFWNAGKDGVDIPFAEENGEMVATYAPGSGVTSVGFIVKLPNWAAKDVSEDQYIDIAAYLSGTVHVYVESGVKGYEIKLGDDVVSGIKLTNAVYKEGVGIQVSMTASIGDGTGAFTVNGPDGVVAVSSVTEGSSYTYTLVPETPLDLYSSYTLTYDGEEYQISMPNVYSTESFEEAYTYAGDDLGAVWTAEKTTFRVWAPTATAVKVNLYESGTEGTDDLIGQLVMTPDVNGTWVAEKEGDLNGVYYTYLVDVDGTTNEACDPYARTTGVNGKRAMVIDLASTDPEGWENDTDSNADQNITDAVIYELHVRDLSVDESSGIVNKGKFLGLIETGTTNSQGIPTGLDHMKDLGITHVHLLPSYDYASVDESKLDTPQFNWGYDPLNYNVPEGSYSTDPYNGAVRVNEFKQMVQSLHDNDIGVVMDVVYNHVADAGNFCFNQIVPGYFSRIHDDGSYQSNSGCGNDTASERTMVRKYIVDSVLYWAEEYHIDGFRWDLVGLIDYETINAVMEEVHAVNPNIIFYGEGWEMCTWTTKDEGEYADDPYSKKMTIQPNDKLVNTEAGVFAFFNATIRNVIHGGVFTATDKGFVCGFNDGNRQTVIDGYMGYSKWGSNSERVDTPLQTINYASCHDNYTLFDNLTIDVMDAYGVTAEEAAEQAAAMNNLAAAYYITAQGVPFIHAGEEMLRSKPDDAQANGFNHNSYAAGDAINAIKWDSLTKELQADTAEYYKGLIAFRKAHPALRMTSEAAVQKASTVLKTGNNNVIAVLNNGGKAEDADILSIFNADSVAHTVNLPSGQWNVYVNKDSAGTDILATVEGKVEVEATSALILVKVAGTGDNPPTGDAFRFAAVSAVAMVSLAACAAFVTLRRRNVF